MSWHESICRIVARRLDEYLDGELRPPLQWMIGLHVHACARCARRYRFERAFLDRVRTRASDIATPPALRDRMCALVQAAADVPVSGRARSDEPGDEL